MSWKEFLKPSLGKVILLVVFIVIGLKSYFSAHPIVICGIQSCFQGSYSDPFWTFVYPVVAAPIFLLEKINANFVKIDESIVGVVGMVLTVIYLYLISCFIVQVIKKIRGKETLNIN